MTSFGNRTSKTVIRGDWKERVKDAARKALKVLLAVCRVLKELHHKPEVGTLGVRGCARGMIGKWRTGLPENGSRYRFSLSVLEEVEEENYCRKHTHH
jgi:hypothetical protein